MHNTSTSRFLRLTAVLTVVWALEACAATPRPLPRSAASSSSSACYGPSALTDHLGRYYVVTDPDIGVPTLPNAQNRPPEHPGGQGTVLMRYIVNERGYPERSSFRVLKATTRDMSEAVIAALADHRFTPAKTRAGCAVRQEVEQAFEFR